MAQFFHHIVLTQRIHDTYCRTEFSARGTVSASLQDWIGSEQLLQSFCIETGEPVRTSSDRSQCISWLMCVVKEQSAGIKKGMFLRLAASDYSIVSAQKPVLWKYEALVLRRRRFRDGSRGGTNALESWFLPDSLPDAHKNVSSRAAASAEELLFSTDLSCIHTHNPLSLKDWLVLWCVYCMIQRARCRRQTFATKGCRKELVV